MRSMLCSECWRLLQVLHIAVVRGLMDLVKMFVNNRNGSGPSEIGKKLMEQRAKGDFFTGQARIRTPLAALLGEH
jgi:hypothetical protein